MKQECHCNSMKSCLLYLLGVCIKRLRHAGNGGACAYAVSGRSKMKNRKNEKGEKSEGAK